MYATEAISIKKTLLSKVVLYFWMSVGAFLAAFAIEVFLIPNQLIDGGVVGIAMIFGNIFGTHLIPPLLLLFTFPFLILAFRYIGKAFLVHMLIAVLLFSGSLVFINHVLGWEFQGSNLEVVVIGGGLLGVGVGLIIREGGCVDGTEILGIIINRKYSFSVGQVVLVCNIFIFSVAGLVFRDWHPPLLSLINFMVAAKVMDTVIVGFEETKSVIIISKLSKNIAQAIIHEMGLGLTVMYGRGGFTGADQEILYVIIERLQLADLKDLIFKEDPNAFIAIENLHEVANGMQGLSIHRKRRKIDRIISRIFGKKVE